MNNIIPTKGDDTGMQTRVWGPAGWLFLHCIAQNYPWDPTPKKKREYLQFFKMVGKVLPCRYCRESYDTFITEQDTLLNISTMANRNTLVKWLYLVHNKVNKKLEVRGAPTFKQVVDKYESFRSKCTKSPPEEKPKKGCFDPMKGFRKKCTIQIENVDSNGNAFGSRSKIKLLSIKKSKIQGKKYTATFEVNNKKKVIHFGAAGMSDYTRNKDPERRKRYITRHKKDLNTKNPVRAGFLSMFILWNKKSLGGSIADYRRRLNIYNRTGKFPVK